MRYRMNRTTFSSPSPPPPKSVELRGSRPVLLRCTMCGRYTEHARISENHRQGKP